jgi:hypothetical protein
VKITSDMVRRLPAHSFGVERMKDGGVLLLFGYLF